MAKENWKTAVIRPLSMSIFGIMSRAGTSPLLTHSRRTGPQNPNGRTFA